MSVENLKKLHFPQTKKRSARCILIPRPDARMMKLT